MSSSNKAVFIGSRLFMKFPDLEYFNSRIEAIGGSVVSTAEMDAVQIEASVEGASAIVALGQTISRKLIERALPTLRFIMTLSVGYDVVDVDAATEHGVPVSNCPLYCSSEVAQHALTLLLSVGRRIDQLHDHVRDGGWDYKQARPIHSLSTSTLGIVGLGRIGRQLAAMTRGLGMRLVAYDPYLDDDLIAAFGVERMYDFAPFLERCDYVSIHCPLNGETRHMFDKGAFHHMKTSAILVNTARGPIIDRVALEEALQSGEISGAGIDVLEIEPPRGDEPILTEKRAVVTPHIAWYSEESHQKNMSDGMDELIRVLEGRRPRFVVNPQIYRDRYEDR